MTTNLLKTQGTSGQIKPPHVNTVCKIQTIGNSKGQMPSFFNKNINSKTTTKFKDKQEMDWRKTCRSKETCQLFTVSGPCSDLDSKHYQTINNLKKQ